MNLVSDLPLWLIGLALLLAMLAAHELGAFGHLRLRGLADGRESGGGDEGFILSGVLGLLALLMAFAFSLALDRYEQRRALVVAEANAIGSFADRLRLLEAPARGVLRQDLARYATMRLKAGRARTERGRVAFDIAADRRRAILGARLIGTLDPLRTTPTAGFLLQGYETLGDVAVERQASRDARLPGRVLALLALYCTAAALMLGYAVAALGSRHRLAAGVFFALLAFAFVTILDLDRPRDGAIQVPQRALAETVRALRH